MNKYRCDFSKPFEGRVARAVSLCLYNKIHMAQLYWPETTAIVRYSTSQLESYPRSPSVNILRMNHRKSAEVYQTNESEEQTIKLLETSSVRDLEPVYDGLIALDESHLDKMIETDLISSS